MMIAQLFNGGLAGRMSSVIWALAGLVGSVALLLAVAFAIYLSWKKWWR